MAPLLLVLSVLLGHEVPPVHLSGVLTPSSGTPGRAEVDPPKARVISTLWRQVVLLFPETVSITPICTMGNRDMLEVWGTLSRSELLPLPSKLMLCVQLSPGWSKGIWRDRHLLWLGRSVLARSEQLLLPGKRYSWLELSSQYRH